jgi:hypothetical protein
VALDVGGVAHDAERSQPRRGARHHAQKVLHADFSLLPGADAEKHVSDMRIWFS